MAQTEKPQKEISMEEALWKSADSPASKTD